MAAASSLGLLHMWPLHYQLKAWVLPHTWHLGCLSLSCGKALAPSVQAGEESPPVGTTQPSFGEGSAPSCFSKLI